MNKAIWLSYDLGVSGDYEGIYAWLAKHGAKECGDSLAFLNYEYEHDNPLVADAERRAKGGSGDDALVRALKADLGGDTLVRALKADLGGAVRLERKSRIYVIFMSGEGKPRGKFLFGSRMQAPWTGYGTVEEETADE